ncbi:metallophosphoesterase [Bacteroidota bacterium]
MIRLYYQINTNNLLRFKAFLSNFITFKLLSIVLITYIHISCTKIAINTYPKNICESDTSSTVDRSKNENGIAGLPIDSEYVILLPDIQNYISEFSYNIYLENIINWILKLKREGYIIKTVFQTGDITNFNSVIEWKIASTIFSKLDNEVEYILCTGNHDYGDKGICNNRNTLFNNYFNYRFNNSYISSYEKNCFENSYFEINIFNQTISVFSLEFGPRDVVINWANQIAINKKRNIGILLTHAYLFKNNERYNFQALNKYQNLSPYNFAIDFPNFGKEKVNDGEDIWQKLIRNNNLRLVFCGHKSYPDNIGTLISKNVENKNVLQMLFDASALPKGGDGWIQIIEFEKKLNSIKVKTFTPLHNMFNNEQIAQYSFDFNDCDGLKI